MITELTTLPVYEVDDLYGAQHLINAIMRRPIADTGMGMLPERLKLRFVVKADSSVSEAQIIRGSTPYDSLFLKSVQQMHHWTPGMKDGQPVNTEMIIPLRICLSQE